MKMKSKEIDDKDFEKEAVYFKDGDEIFFEPTEEDWMICCCDCSLVHQMHIERHLDGALGLFFYRDQEKTDRMRNHRGQAAQVLGEDKTQFADLASYKLERGRLLGKAIIDGMETQGVKELIVEAGKELIRRDALAFMARQEKEYADKVEKDQVLLSPDEAS